MNLGTHILVEFSKCNVEKLKNVQNIQEAMLAGAQAANATIVSYHFQQFEPSGVSGAVILAESHFSCHTWPEHGLASIDIYTCGEKANPFLAKEYMKNWLEAEHEECMQVLRGIMRNDVYNLEIKKNFP